MKRAERAEQILGHAARVFFEKGYDRASIRDVAGAAGMSLAGLYYHFRSKEEILHRVQERVYSDLIATARQSLSDVRGPVQRLRAFIQSHLAYFVTNLTEMKVLSHEYHRLRGEEYASLARLRREYYDVAEGIVAAVRAAGGGGDGSIRVAVLSLFGMMNWLYTWYRPDRDPGADELASQMTGIYLHGLAPFRHESG